MRRAAATLVYRDTCPRCRLLSFALVCLTLGALRRLPLRLPEARELYAEHRLHRGKLTLITNRGTFEGWDAVLGLLRLPLAVLRRHD